MEVDVPPDVIIDVVDEDDDITDDEDALPHDLAVSNNEDLINVDDDDVARSHGGEGGGKGKRKPNLGGRAAARLNTGDKTRNLSLKEITDTKGPVPIQFELRDKQTIMPLGDHAAHWSSYIGEVIRSVPLYYPSCLKVLKERKATLITDIRTQFDLRLHMESLDRIEINAGIQQHLQKAYNTNNAAFKAQHWVIDSTTGTYNLEKIRRERPENITASEWDKYIKFWNDPRNIARAAQNRQNRAKSTMQTSTTQEYPSLIDTFFVAHTINVELLWDEDRCIYEMRRLEAMGTYTDDEINRLAIRGKQRGHIASVGRFKSGGASRSGGCGDEKEGTDHQDDKDEDGDVSSGIVVEEGIPYERSPATFPRRQVAGERNPQRQVAGEAPNCRWGKHLIESCGLGFDTSTNTWKMVCVLLKEGAPPDKKYLCTLVHVFGTNSCYSDIKTEDGGTPVIWFDVKKEEFGLIDPPKRMHQIRRNYSCLDQVVDLNGEVGYVCTNIMEFWLLNHKKLWLPHCRFKNEIVPDGLLIDVIGCWNKDGDILIKSIGCDPV
nr:hypothetical protein [Tanacetum cinerariifolium]